MLNNNDDKYASLLTINSVSKKREYFIGFNYKKEIVHCNETEDEIFVFNDVNQLFLNLNQKIINEIKSPLLEHRHLMSTRLIIQSIWQEMEILINIQILMNSD